MEFPRTVRAYVDECEFVADLIKGGEWIDQDAFDKASWDWSRSDRKVTYRRYDSEALVHFDYHGDLNLLVLQQFCLAGLAEARKRADGKIEYRGLTAESQAA